MFLDIFNLLVYFSRYGKQIFAPLPWETRQRSCTAKARDQLKSETLRYNYGKSGWFYYSDGWYHDSYGIKSVFRLAQV